MMADEQYRKRWLRKKQLYEDNGYTVLSEENTEGRLIVTEDSWEQGLDSQLIERIAWRLIA